MARRHLSLRRLRRLAELDSGRRALLVEAALWLLLARLALAFVSFPLLARRLGAFVSPTDTRVAQGRSGTRQEHVLVAREIGWAMTRAARHVPYRAVCLPQAMAARIMLRRRGVPSVVHFGAAKGMGQRLDTHAWLDAAGVEVTGFPVAESFAEIACFV
jgi:hypothetical protein